MSQYKPMMAGHPATQKQKAKEEDGLATTMLHIAALEGDVQRIGQLLRQGLFVDAPDQALKTPLHLATQYGQLQSMEVLLKVGADVDARSDIGQTPLMLAVQQGNAEASAKLLKLGLDLEAADHKGRTALHYAVMQGDVALLQMLLEAGADANAKDSFASTPLYSAVKLKSVAASQLLLAWKAEPLVATAYRDTALHQAVSQGLVQLLPGILKDAPAGVLDGLTDSQQNNALHAAALAGDSSPAVQVLLLLLRSGMALECPGMLGWTALHCAVRSKHVTIAQCLLQTGASIKIRASDGLSVQEFVARNIDRAGYSIFADLLEK